MTGNNRADISKSNKAEDTLPEKTLLAQVFIDALPCVALLLDRNRSVLRANQAGVKAGALPGTQCFSAWMQRNAPCSWCRAPVALATGQAQHRVVEALGAVWDTHWIPVHSNLYLHYEYY